MSMFVSLPDGSTVNALHVVYVSKVEAYLGGPTYGFAVNVINQPNPITLLFTTEPEAKAALRRVNDALNNTSQRMVRSDF
jgi:hypothetical protein